MQLKQSTYVVKLAAKALSSLMAAFILFMFIAELFGEVYKPAIPKRVIRPVKVGQCLTISDSLEGGSWQSSNPSVAVVDTASGRLTGIGTGSVNITHTANTGTKNYLIDIAPSTTHDAIMLSMLALVWIGLLLAWWREVIGAWFNIFTITAQITLLFIMNHLPLLQPAAFCIGAIPGVLILFCRKIEKSKRAAPTDVSSH